MSKLIVKEVGLGDFAEQEMTCNENSFLSAVRIHVYRHRFPTGSVKMQILDTNKRLMGESETLAISSLDVDTGTTGLDFFHGIVNFDFNLPIKSGVNFFLRMVGTAGYSFSETAYIGWVNGFDLRKLDADYTPNDNEKAALLWEPWVRRRTLRGST